MIKLFPYQTIGAEFLASRKVACLFDEMGVGKSAQAITACDLVGAKKVLVICRAVARINWQREFDKFSKGKPELTITSYEGLRKILDQTTLVFDVAIVDEAHYAKEPGAARTQSVLGKTGAVRRAKRTWLLTGSPTPNHAGELWTALYTFGRTRLSYDQFLERYCTSRVTSYGRQITGSAVEPDRIAELRGMLEPIALRRTKEDVNLELPPIFYSDLVVKPGPVELISCYSFQKYVTPVDRTKDLEKILEDQLGVINGIVKGKFTDAAMKALEANAKSIMTLRRYQSMQKVEPVFELIAQELEDKAYEKLVVFAIHRDTIVNLQQKLGKKYGAALIFGGTKPETLQARVDQFQNSKIARVLICQLHCAGTSLTLTASDQVMFVDLDWVPGNNEQAAARCHRIGQTRPVTVRCVMLENSFDQHISRVLMRKTAQLKSLMNGTLKGQTVEDVNELL